MGAMIHFLVVGQPATVDFQRFAVFCSAPVGDILHCLSDCSMFEDLRAQWCLRCAIPPESGPQWTRHQWLFDCSCPLNSPGLIRAHIRFVGEASERFVSLTGAL